MKLYLLLLYYYCYNLIIKNNLIFICHAGCFVCNKPSLISKIEFGNKCEENQIILRN